MKLVRSALVRRFLLRAGAENRSAARDVVKGAGTIIDVFGTSAPRPNYGTQQQDYQAVMGDFSAVCGDVYPAMNSLRNAAGKR